MRFANPFGVVSSAILLAASMMAPSAAFGQLPGGVSRTWAPVPGNNNWNSPGNWNPGGVPGANDRAVVPGNSGLIVVGSGVIRAHELALQSSADGNPANNTVLQGNPHLRIHLRTVPGNPGVATIGPECKLQGRPGTNGVALPGGGGTRGSEGGGVEIVSPGGVGVVGAIIINNGAICGGSGGDGPDGVESRDGGAVRITADTLQNNGLTSGGSGGAKVGAQGSHGGRDGGKGGDVELSVKHLTGAGACVGGPGGGYSNPTGPQLGRPGFGGDVHSLGELAYAPGRSVNGSRINLHTNASLNLGGAGAGAFIATLGAIRIDAPSLNLTGIAAGTHVFQAPEVQIHCPSILLNPGVTLGSLCGAAVVLVGNNAAAEFSTELFGTEAFDDASAAAPPAGWANTVLLGAGGFLFNNPAAIPLDPRFGIGAAIVTPATSGPGPLSAKLESPMLFECGGLVGPVLLEWEQRHQTCTCGAGVAQVFVVANNVSTLVYTNSLGTPAFDFVQLNIAPVIAGADSFFVRFQYNGLNNGFWIVDDFCIRLPAPAPIGQPASPGIACLKINDARNADNAPVTGGVAGPFFTDVHVGDLFELHIDGPSSTYFFPCIGSLSPGSLDIGGLGGLGWLDLDLGSFSVLDPFPLGGLGTFDLPFIVPPPMAGLTLGLQAAVVDPASGVTLSNAVEVHFGP